MDWLLVFVLSWMSGFLLGWGLHSTPRRYRTMNDKDIERRLYQ